MNPGRDHFLLSGLVLALFLLGISGVQALPVIDAPVVDKAGVLSPSEIEELSTTLIDHYEATGVQMAVLFVATTGEETIEDYSLQVAQQWGGGSAEDDTGILLTFAIEDRRNRLELGYGIEPLIPDRVAAEILEGVVFLLRGEQYGTAAAKIVDEVIARTDRLEPGQSYATVLGPWFALIAVFLLVYLGLFQGVVVAGSVGRLQGAKPYDPEEDPLNLGDVAKGLGKGIFPLLLLGIYHLLFVKVFDLDLIALVDHLFTDAQIHSAGMAVVIASVLLFLIRLAELAPRPGQGLLLPFWVLWLGIPVAGILYFFAGWHLSPQWSVPLTSSALAWAFLCWGSMVVITAGLLSVLPRGYAIFITYVVHHIPLVFVITNIIPDVDIDLLLFGGTWVLALYIIGWCIFADQIQTYRSTASHQRTYRSSGGSSGFSSGGGGFSSSGGGFSGGGGSFGGGGASGSW